MSDDIKAMQMQLARWYGLCPECGELGRKVDVARARYNACPEHRAYWLAGWDVADTTGADPESLEAHWSAGYEALKGWRVVTPAYPPSPSRDAFIAGNARQRERVAQLRMLADALEAMHPFELEREFGQRDFDSYSF